LTGREVPRAAEGLGEDLEEPAVDRRKCAPGVSSGRSRPVGSGDDEGSFRLGHIDECLVGEPLV
jgi:hypothetical protein